MKDRFISLLALALFSTVFAAGCAKLDTCSKAKSAEECAKDQFAEGLVCKWMKDPKASDPKAKEVCVDTWEANAEAKAECAEADKATSDRQSACDKAGLSANKKDKFATCKFEGEAGSEKCNAAKKTK